MSKPDEIYKGWKIFFLGKEDADGMWEDRVEPILYDGLVRSSLIDRAGS